MILPFVQYYCCFFFHVQYKTVLKFCRFLLIQWNNTQCVLTSILTDFKIVNTERIFFLILLLLILFCFLCCVCVCFFCLRPVSCVECCQGLKRLFDLFSLLIQKHCLWLIIVYYQSLIRNFSFNVQYVTKRDQGIRVSEMSSPSSLRMAIRRVGSEELRAHHFFLNVAYSSF